MKWRLLTLFLFAAVAAFFASCACGNNEEIAEEETKFLPLGFDPDEYTIVTDSVRLGDTFNSMMIRHGMDATAAYKISHACPDSVFLPSRIVADKKIDAYYKNDTLKYLVYHKNLISCTVFQCTDSIAVWGYDKPVIHERKYADITITESLWNDMIRAGASPVLIMSLADIYQWSVNFFTLQEQDRFRVIYTQSVCDGEVLAIDTVHFCVFNSDKTEVAAVRFSPEGKKAGYWGKDGVSLKRMFLKAPLKYNRISSRFTYHRKHPVTGKVRPHTAVDYAAPKGTPVHSIGEGVVTLCGWDGSGGGNRIKIKHNQGYESCYMHLSGFAKGIKKGSRVSQGQLIGYVGSTGRSTGPHLDFRVWKGGKPMDPLKLNSPASDPLASKYMDEFNKLYESYFSQLNEM